MSPEPRAIDRPSYYTMKTPALVAAPSPQGLAHSGASPPCYFSVKQRTSPVPSPRSSPSLGQPRPPKPSTRGPRGRAPSPRPASPNYFGLTVDPALEARDSCLVPRDNWSSQSSSAIIQPFAAVIPPQVSLDANPEFEAFRRHIDASRGRKGFNLSLSSATLALGSPRGTPGASTPSALPSQPPPPPPPPPACRGPGETPKARPMRPVPGPLGLGRDGADRLPADAVVENAQGPVSVSAGGKAVSTLSLSLPVPPPPPKLPSSDGAGSLPAAADARPSSPTMVGAPPSRAGPSAGPQPQPQPQLRPPGGSDVPAMIMPDELRDLLEGDQAGNILLLDLRISPQFAQARVRGALNLCIPTTLLKRATFNLQKLQQTFQRDEDEQRFSNWRDASHLVVYDSSSSERRDAVSAMNMIKKFTSEGYTGSACILRGGFNSFALAHPNLIDRSGNAPGPGLSLCSGAASGGPRVNLPPVIGGVVLPNAGVGPAPFFANIRQNQDLIDGVGQMDVGMPAGLSPSSLPRWLQEAADAGDHGKRVSDKFLHIERAEQSRMRDAYSLTGSDHDRSRSGVDGATPRVQLSGLEMGAKNRYKDILPFEHARVKLLGRPEGACDYVNASHLRAKRTHKRYIASQGPLPTTFEDFWTMVWDNDVRVIVMLTAECEGGQTKCHAYWEGSDFGPIRLRLVSEKKVLLDATDKRRPARQASTSHDAPAADVGRRRANTMATPEPSGPPARQLQAGSQAAAASAETSFVVVRKFAVSHVAYPFLPMREVTQLHYQSWPDFGTPAQPSHLLALVELANVMQRTARPVDATGRAAASSSAASSRAGSHDAAAHPLSCHAAGGRNGAAGARPRDDGVGVPLLSWQEPVTPEHDRPMLVHCSAGCGRTGAFCTVDSVIDMLKRQRQHMHRQRFRGGRTQAQDDAQPPRPDAEGDVFMADEEEGEDKAGEEGGERGSGSRPGTEGDFSIDTSWLEDDSIDLIAQTVEDFRGQRLSMVQSLRQFVLCYETILEWMRRLQQDLGGGEHEANGRARSGSVRF
ncbi:hypothetical protein VTJ83DRAFT_6200 [Remersonia thermophila]|uniref:protein-tyrosine-phosphatase n=1 Tax=Remersonia thermophila TaxID=72144 RepID=A0ABR4D455_9PEZI